MDASGVSPSSARDASQFIYGLTCATFAAALLLGGAARRGLISDLLPELLGLALIAVCLPAAAPKLAQHRLVSATLLCIVALPLLHLIPLPPALWMALPGRDGVAQADVAAGLGAVWRPLSLAPDQTWRSFLSLSPAVGLFLATLTLDAGRRKALLGMALAAALVSAILGMLQVMGGVDSPLYFFEVTNRGAAVGSFANANHFAALFYCALPLAAALLARRRPVGGMPTWWIGVAAMIVCIVGLSLSGSRSALFLGTASLAASLLFVAGERARGIVRGRAGLALTALVAVAVTSLALGVGLIKIFGRLQAQDILEDARWTIAGVTWDVIKAHFPVGSGWGSFEDVYQIHEPAQAVMVEIVNHAHNDWLEIVAEGGVAAAMIAGLAIFALMRLGSRALTQADDEAAPLARASIVIIVLLAVHSLVDYPLRTISLMSLFALACACLTPPAPEPSRRKRRRQIMATA